jgi:hypothetical protein
MRPVFEVSLPTAGTAVLAEIRRRLHDPSARIEGAVLASGAELTTVRREAHFWSPYLSVEVARDEGGAWRLKGRFAPEPNVWILFIGIYGILGMFGLFGLMYGLSQWLVNEAPWGLAAGPAALALMAFTYGAAFIGQGLGAEEMYRLRSFIDDCVEGASERPREVDGPQG